MAQEWSFGATRSGCHLGVEKNNCRTAGAASPTNQSTAVNWSLFGRWRPPSADWRARLNSGRKETSLKYPRSTVAYPKPKRVCKGRIQGAEFLHLCDVLAVTVRGGALTLAGHSRFTCSSNLRNQHRRLVQDILPLLLTRLTVGTCIATLTPASARAARTRARKSCFGRGRRQINWTALAVMSQWLILQ
jgi:hypothetical protein